MAKPRMRSSCLRSEALFLGPLSRHDCCRFSSLMPIQQIASPCRWVLSHCKRNLWLSRWGRQAEILIATDGLWVVEVELWVYARRCRRKDRAPQECDPSSRRPALRLETESREGLGLSQRQPGAVQAINSGGLGAAPPSPHIPAALTQPKRCSCIRPMLRKLVRLGSRGQPCQAKQLDPPVVADPV